MRRKQAAGGRLRSRFEKKAVNVLLLLLTASALGGCQEKGPDKLELRMAGIEKLDAGDYAGAVADFESAIQASKGRVGDFEVDVLKYRAEAEYMLKDYPAAAHTYDVLMQVDQKDPEYLYADAVMKALGQDPDGALEAYLEGVQLEAEGSKHAKDAEAESGGFDRMSALTAVAEACLRDGRQEEVSALYDAAVADGAAGPSVFNSMGLTYLEAGQYEEALTCFDRAIQSADRAAGSGDGAEEKSEEGSSAAAQAGTSVELQAVRNARFNQAVVYEHQGQYQKALQAFETYVAEFGPDEAAQKEITFLQTR